MNAAPGFIRSSKVEALDNMLAAIARETGVPVRELHSHSRMQHQVDVRVRFIREAHALGFGCWSIARALRRDHTTILHHLGRTNASRALVRGQLVPRKVTANVPRVACDSDSVKA